MQVTIYVCQQWNKQVTYNLLELYNVYISWMGSDAATLHTFATEYLDTKTLSTISFLSAAHQSRQVQ